MIILVDTNVLLSAALRNRLPERVVRHVVTDGNCRWVVTPEILTEYLEVLRRPKFSLPAETVQRWAELIEMCTVVVSTPAPLVSFPRDPKDAPFLSAAIATGADYLITGDNDLLQAKISIAARIISESDFAAESGIS
jgi:putative PIN family toxin of toxin-antitoxin system